MWTRLARFGWRRAATAGGCATATAAAYANSANCDAIEAFRSAESERVCRRDLVRCVGAKTELEDNYQMFGQVGLGGFGTVRLAKHRITGFLRAVKTVSTGHHDIPAQEDWGRMLSEVEALIDLTHPNIVRLFEYYRDDDNLYMVEEYCRGGSLEQRLEESGGCLAPEEAAVVLRQVLRGVLCCHAHGLAHRDLKPDNFCFGSADPESSLKLIDFGLSLGPCVDARPSPGGGSMSMAGTLEHSAPETFPQPQPDGQQPRRLRYGQAADMWSVGAIFFKLLTGENLVELNRDRRAVDFGTRLRAVVAGDGATGVDRELIDDAARKIRSEEFVRRRIALARERAPPAACELLELLLQQDPAQRLTATQALKHRFITDSYLSPGSLPLRRYALDAETIDRMRRFAGAPGLRRLAVLVEAHLLGPQDDDTIKQQVCTFRAVDECGMGVLTAADIAAALRAQGHDVPADLEEICLRLDSILSAGTRTALRVARASDRPVFGCLCGQSRGTARSTSSSLWLPRWSRASAATHGSAARPSAFWMPMATASSRWPTWRR